MSDFGLGAFCQSQEKQGFIQVPTSFECSLGLLAGNNFGDCSSVRLPSFPVQNQITFAPMQKSSLTSSSRTWVIEKWGRKNRQNKREIKNIAAKNASHLSKSNLAYLGYITELKK